MWLFTNFGFFSIVRKSSDSDELTIRSRTLGDLQRLRTCYLPRMTEPVAYAGTDYPWRARCEKSDLQAAMSRIVEDIEYANFKDEVATDLGKPRAKRYAKVWDALHGMDDDLPEPVHEGWDGLPWAQVKGAGKALAFGGVVVDREGNFLVREVANHYDGYVWSFAKGRPDPGESPRQTALREVREEMGVDARILLPLAGAFEGGTTRNHFFLMTVDRRSVDMEFGSRETARLAWATPQEARGLLSESSNATGRKRDLDILDAALAALPSPLPLQRPIARSEDWRRRPLPAARTTLDYQRTFAPHDMAQVVRGFLAHMMEEKWCIWFEDGVLRLNRSWTGIEVYRLHLAPVAASPGHWEVRRAEVNRHRGQWNLFERDDEDLELLSHLVENLLIRYGEAPGTDPFVRALSQAMTPNYLGAPAVVRSLLEPVIQLAILRAQDRSDAGALAGANMAFVAAMTDDPGFTRMPWHSREQLGETLVARMNLNPRSCAPLDLAKLVYLSLAALGDAVRKILEPAGGLSPDAQARIEALAQFVASVFLGTHDVTHPGKTLADMSEVRQ